MSWRIRDDTLIIGKYSPSDSKVDTKAQVSSQKRKIALFDFVGQHPVLAMPS